MSCQDQAKGPIARNLSARSAAAEMLVRHPGQRQRAGGGDVHPTGGVAGEPAAVDQPADLQLPWPRRSRARPAAAAPSGPLTARRSPARAPDRGTTRSASPSAVTASDSAGPADTSPPTTPAPYARHASATPAYTRSSSSTAVLAG